MCLPKCDKCFYGDVCRKPGGCDDFTPVISNPEDDVDDSTPEEFRDEYRKAFFEYIKEFD